jgi:glycerol-3-phosphate dehydrogenase
MHDVIIIGAGITGSAIAFELSKYQMSVLVLEKENDVGSGATMANSAIIHSGHDPKPGTLKAKLNALGNALYDDLENDLQIPLLRTGAYLVAHGEAEEKKLEELKKRAALNGVEAFYIPLEEAFKKEPHLSKTITKVVSLPTTKVTFPWEVALAFMETAVVNGVQLEKNQSVKAIEKIKDIFEVTTEKGTFKSRYIINAAGVYAETIASFIETVVPYQTKPRKGEYFVIDRRAKGFMNHVIYPVPTEKGKGVLITPQVHGEILIGPTSEYTSHFDSTNTTKEGLSWVKNEAQKLAENIPYEKTIRTFAGLRPSLKEYDFYIQESNEVSHFIHVAGIDSPGLTAAPAIGLYVKDILCDKEEFLIKKNYTTKRKKITPYRMMDGPQKKEAFALDSQYGRLICKCERVTEADVVLAIHRPVPADSIKAVKKRTRAGAGICQGGYCEHNVIEIIARELSIPKTLVNYYNPNTQILIGETKGEH